jgi:hypothetical protein
VTAADWATAACRRSADARIFAPHRADTTDAIRAAGHCRTCPIRDPCYQLAASTDRTDGVVMGGAYWSQGQPVTIPDADNPMGPSRSAKLADRRRRAINRYYEIRAGHPHDASAYRQVAAEYGVTYATAYGWHRQLRAEGALKMKAIERKAGGAT